MVERDIALAELTGGRVHVAHMSARQSLRAVRDAQGARRANVTCEVAPHHFVLTDEALDAPMPLRHQRQDEPAAARGGRPRRDARGTRRRHRRRRSPPTTRRITPTRSWSSSTARRSASSASRPACRWSSIGWCTPGGSALAALIELLSVEPGARASGCPADRWPEGAPADITVLAPDAPVTIRAAALRSKSKNTPFDGWTLKRRGRGDDRRRKSRLLNAVCRLSPDATTSDRRTSETSLRQQALRQLRAVRSADARRALRLRQRLPRPRLPEPAPAVPASVDDLAAGAGSARRAAGRAAGADRRRRRPGDRRRAAGAHAGRPARRPPRADASAVQLRAVRQPRRQDFALRDFYARQMAGKRVLLADDVRNTGKTFAALRRAGARRPAAPCSRRSRSTIAWRRSWTSACPTSRWPNTRRRRTSPAAECPMCQAGEPVTTF